MPTLSTQLMAEGIQAEQSGNKRLAKQKYLQAFRAYEDRWHVGRWISFSLFTTAMEDNRNMSTSVDDDVATLKAIMEDKKELRLYRIEAAWTAGVVFNDRAMRRDEAADCLREALEISENIPKNEKRHKVGVSIGPGRVTFKSMEELISPIVDECKKNLDRHVTPISSRIAREQGSLEDFLGEQSNMTLADFSHLSSVGGDTCDYCGKSREELGVTLLDVCARCKKAYYCSRECQMKQWKAGHKKHCRKPSEFMPGDKVILFGLKSKPHFKGTMAQVIEEDPNNKGCWKVKAFSGFETFSVPSERVIGEDPNHQGCWNLKADSGFETISVPSETMQHVRPLK